LDFPSKFRDWISTLLSTSSSRVLLNGVDGVPIKHGRGLRQGDPLSPLLFVLAIDPLHHILCKATVQGRLHKLSGRAPTTCTSLYADDAAIFVAPIKDDINFLENSLTSFDQVTGLVTNCAKSHAAPITCENINLEETPYMLSRTICLPPNEVFRPPIVRDTTRKNSLSIWKIEWLARLSLRLEGIPLWLVEWFSLKR
jgi:hypothetical protein